MLAHVGGADNEIADSARPPKARGALLAFTAQQGTLVSGAGARNFQRVQVVGNLLTGLPFDGSQAIDEAYDFRFGDTEVVDWLPGDN